MKVNDIVMVTENRKGTETNFLMTVTDYIEHIDLNALESRQDVAEVMLELGSTLASEETWSEIYNWANKTISARFCSSELQLQLFLQGYLNSTDQEVHFDEERCSKECLENLRVMGKNMIRVCKNPIAKQFGMDFCIVFMKILNKYENY